VGELCCEVKRYKVPDLDMEVRIYGEDGEIPRASHWMCEECTDIALSLEAVGFCPKTWLDQRALLKEYVEVYVKR